MALGREAGDVTDLDEQPCGAGGSDAVQVQQHVRRWHHLMNAVAAIPGGGLPYPGETAAAGDHVAFQHRLRTAAQHQIDPADHAGAKFRRAERSARTHRGDAGDEFGIAKRLFFGRSAGAIHGMAFFEDRRDDIMAAVCVGEQFGQQVNVAIPHPQMMVRIDDG